MQTATDLQIIEETRDRKKKKTCFFRNKEGKRKIEGRTLIVQSNGGLDPPENKKEKLLLRKLVALLVKAESIRG